MKYILKIVGIFFLAGLILTSCKKDFPNINAPSDDQIFKDKEGLEAASIGLIQHFSTSTLSPIVEIPGITTREFGVSSTYVTPMELTYGGTALSGENAGIVRLWSRLLRDKGMAENIIANVDNVEMPAGTKSGIKALAKFMKAMTLGYLVMDFQEAPINDGVDAEFSDRTAVLTEAVNLLKSALNDIDADPISDDFKTKVIPTIDLKNSIEAFLARYYLYLGDYANAIATADKVDLTSKSEWWYDGSENKNPVFVFAVDGQPDTKPRWNFGIMLNTDTGYVQYQPEPGDGRLTFYMDTTVHEYALPEFGGYEVHNLKGFFANGNTKIPVYLPGEMILIKAEAYAREDNLADAVKEINVIREKTNDVFGVNAGLGPWTGDATSKEAVLNEIYIQRCIELFLTGQRLEDSRRIHSSFVPSPDKDIVSERNRNFYPYSYEERNNNPNCPPDPAI
ncbi:RagB/SusD family nutrient uptake outer membrane protein [Candidatus Sulfidibacterium hydrothermale]|uniref:RagB/SusD family nutrient uptake outer membrane protein n=1 Tax=Candidatus Sulfidibacterium hydrothermale TaxID=2875962 RepID=UPI001F0AF249|nr:RagB/SusD family nutrient uptake outer membrane protein [Candidatus Sulfidibacterium hydrothermale]UBM63455.1 RagB/SusD family nutrient uptake outer membrane protein [Candidatus Sulfidibacterium hydrothermale]